MARSASLPDLGSLFLSDMNCTFLSVVDHAGLRFDEQHNLIRAAIDFAENKNEPRSCQARLIYLQHVVFIIYFT